MLNPDIKLISLSEGKVWATLEIVNNFNTGGKAKKYSFLINPSKVQISHDVKFSSLDILQANYQQHLPLSRATTITYPDVLIVGQSLMQDMTPIISGLETLTMFDKDGNYPLLKLAYGSTVYPTVYLQSFPYEILKRTSGRVSYATGSLSFLVDIAEPTANKENEATKLLSIAEKNQLVKQIRDKFNKDRKLAEKFGIAKDTVLSVNDDGVITTVLKGIRRKIGVYGEIK